MNLKFKTWDCYNTRSATENNTIYSISINYWNNNYTASFMSCYNTDNFHIPNDDFKKICYVYYGLLFNNLKFDNIQSAKDHFDEFLLNFKKYEALSLFI